MYLTMRITSLNLRGFFDWEQRSKRVIDFLRHTDSDVILFQEVVYLPDESPFSPVELLNRSLGYPYRHSAITRLQDSPTYGVYREGLAVLSRLPIPSTEALVLRHEDHDPHHRIVQFLDVQDGPVTHRLADVHLSVRDDFALHHLQEVLAILADRGEQRIIGGDFNVNHLEQHRSLWRDDYVLTSDIEQYVSYPHSRQANDYFLVPKTYAIGEIRLSSNDLSDHRALTVDLDLTAAVDLTAAAADATPQSAAAQSVTAAQSVVSARAAGQSEVSAPAATG